ncbi:MAG: RidA family protein [Candidatus Atribacteria bacterium]|jgi:2-iminobutanoate/2-iminopropanoate deaminase|nr:RidA family protein [Candidatus Atribacteria bacterium]
MKKEVIFTKKTPLPGGQYSQAIKVGDFIFTSGQTARDLKSGELLSPGDIEAQTDIIMKNIEILLNAGGTSLSNVIKSSVFIDDYRKFKLFNNVYKKYFFKDPPVRTAVAIGNFEKGMCIEIDVIALVQNK